MASVEVNEEVRLPAVTAKKNEQIDYTDEMELFIVNAGIQEGVNTQPYGNKNAAEQRLFDLVLADPLFDSVANLTKAKVITHKLCLCQ